MNSTGLFHNSIAEIPEDLLVQRLLSDPLWGAEFFELASMPEGMANRQCVPLDTAPGNFKGDIDAILCAPNHPEHSVAYQVKRIKFGINQVRNRTPGKLREYRKLVRQANLLAQMGFWQVYAYVIVVVDARQQNAGSNTYAGLSSELKSIVASAISTESLDARVGLATLDFTQTMDHKPFTVGTHGLLDSRHRSTKIRGELLICGIRWVVH